MQIKELEEKLKIELNTVHKKILRDKVTQRMFGANGNPQNKKLDTQESLKLVDDIVENLTEKLMVSGFKSVIEEIERLKI